MSSVSDQARGQRSPCEYWILDGIGAKQYAETPEIAVTCEEERMMRADRVLDDSEVDGLLKAVLVFSRTANHVLESRAIEDAGERLSESKVQILRLLGQRGSQTPGRLARFLCVSKPAVTQIIDSLVATELVRRRRICEDRRGTELALTPRGKQVFLKIHRQQRQVIRNSVRRVAEQDVSRWILTLEELAHALTRADKTFRGYCMQCGAHEDGTCVLTGGSAECLFLKHGNDASVMPARRVTIARKKRKQDRGV